MTLYDRLEDNLNDKDELTRTLLEFDYMLKLLHNNGFCIYDFNPKKIILENGKLTFNSFKNVLNDIGIGQNIKEINIYQLSKIGLMSYNNVITDGKMNQEHFDFIRNNLEQFNQNGYIPEDIYEYYEEIFRRLSVTYLNDYLNKKKEELSNSQNTIVKKKVLATEVGRALTKEDKENAFINIMFIPSILALGYLLSVIIYIFVIKQ